MPTSSIATTFAAWARDLRAADVPAEVRQRTALRVADAVGLMAAAWSTPAGAAVREVAAELGGDGSRLLLDPAPLHPAAAALVHGTLVHTLDFDDTFPSSVIHPMSVLLPTALAVADGSRPGADLITAVAAGDELLARLGSAAGRGFHSRGFQATGVLGPLAAALVAGVSQGREPAAIASAMGLSGSMSGGLLEFLSDGTWSKRLHPGWAAHGGIVADGLAARGFPGPASVVEGRHGVFASFLDVPADEDAITEGLGDRWASAEAEVKLYPCAHVLHPFIEMALALRERVDAARVERIVCEVAPWYVPIVCEPVAEKTAPVTEYQARASLPAAVALALVDGRVGVASFEPDSVGRDAVRALARRVEYVADPALAEGFGARMHVVAGGERFDGDPAVQVDEAAAVRRKFDDNTGGADALWTAARHLDDHTVDDLYESAAELTR
ncbi:MmgE/PrpD family protein [Actinomadura syzygii]|uniref:MmgE/PrpD family protein n=1 Tax=Actinomadura syzygii TaxID=1427538 RepID=A0A5D0U3K2_9ACTN|nr:MmgE/PrpD family protein [Actinomadura syzygii]TYC13211.1 MmgE/PrpD family protein [Actinomadura syzygii]